MLSLLISLDHLFFFLINRGMQHPVMDDVFHGLSSMGGWTVGLITLFLLATEGRRLLARHLLVLVLFLVMTAAVNEYLKRVIDRPRPTVVFQSEPRDADGPRLRVLEVDPPRRYAFPSGHSMTAFFMLVYAGQRRRALRPWLWLVAAGIAMGRVYVGVHFPLDCLAGSLIGASGAWLASTVFHRLEGILWIPCRDPLTATPTATPGYSAAEH